MRVVQAILCGLFLTMAVPVAALTLADCTRTTHISHGGESDHLDLGDGRVMWVDWWSQEGTATNHSVQDCTDGQALRFRSAEENMNTRLPFNRTAKALAVVARHENGARVFATFARIAADLETIARDIEIVTLTDESCACAVLYPDMRGDKIPFEVHQ